MPHWPFTLVLILLASGCARDDQPQRRTRMPAKDAECRDPARPSAYLYPSTNRQFGPDDPNADKCELLVPDHMFCCPNADKPTDR